MKLELLTDKNASQTLIRLVRTCKQMDVAVAWAGKNQVVEVMIEHHKKLRHVVIGTHMYQTDPAVLRSFMPFSAVRCMPPDGQLFHPKVYLFKLDNAFAAVIGSHNLTEGAFGARNIEASVLIQCDPSDDALRSIDGFIQASFGRLLRKR